MKLLSADLNRQQQKKLTPSLVKQNISELNQQLIAQIQVATKK